MNQLFLACGDMNECQDNFWSLYNLFTVDFQCIIQFVMYLTLAAEFWSIDCF